MALDIADVPAVQKPRDLLFYLVLFGLVLPLWAVVPFSWFFLTYVVVTGKVWLYAWPGWVLVVFASSEAVFSLYHRHLATHVSRLKPFDQFKLIEIEAAFKRLLKSGLARSLQNGREPLEELATRLEWDDPRAIDFRNNLRTWFRRATWSSIRLREIRQWIYWSIYNTDMPPFDGLPLEQQTVVNEAVRLLEMRTGCSIPEGSDTQNMPMRITIDPVKIHWRPLFFYVLTGLINRYLRWWFADRYHMEYTSHQGLEYLIRIPKDWDNASGPRPILFIHGLGFGILQYSIFLCHLLNVISDRPVLVLLQPHISQDFFHPRYLRPLNRRETTEALQSMLLKLGWVDHTLVRRVSEKSVQAEEGNDSPLSKTQGITILSHSNGSFAHAWLLKDCRKIVARSCFVDPVAFCLWEGDVCYNVVYRRSTTAMELLMKYFVASELGVANLLHRHFDWASNSLWYEEISEARDPAKTVFVLGGKDAILNPERILEYLQSYGINEGIWYNPNGTHGQALLAGSDAKEILRWLQDE